jgi:hypothetical protein
LVAGQPVSFINEVYKPKYLIHSEKNLKIEGGGRMRKIKVAMNYAK